MKGFLYRKASPLHLLAGCWLVFLLAACGISNGVRVWHPHADEDANAYPDHFTGEVSPHL